jgi:hypothetical protein
MPLFPKFFIVNTMNAFSFPTDHFLMVIRRANEEPVKKYTTPQTEAQEVGWINKLLVRMINQEPLD